MPATCRRSSRVASPAVWLAMPFATVMRQRASGPGSVPGGRSPSATARRNRSQTRGALVAPGNEASRVWPAVSSTAKDAWTPWYPVGQSGRVVAHTEPSRNAVATCRVVGSSRARATYEAGSSAERSSALRNGYSLLPEGRVHAGARGAHGTRQVGEAGAFAAVLPEDPHGPFEGLARVEAPRPADPHLPPRRDRLPGYRWKQITEENLAHVFDVDVRGTLFTVQEALPLPNDGASLILNASTAADDGAEGSRLYARPRPPYGPSPGSRPTNPRAAVSGATPSRRARSTLLGHRPGRSGERGQSPGRACRGHRAGPDGTPEAGATAVACLAFDQSSFILGADLHADGGENQICPRSGSFRSARPITGPRCRCRCRCRSRSGRPAGA